MTESAENVFRRATDSRPGSTDIELNLGQILGVVRRGWWILALTGLIGGVLAALLVLQVTPVYTSRAQILLTQPNRADDTLGNLFEELNLDNETIAGQIAVITSGRLLTRVSAQLDLQTLPEFNATLLAPAPEPGPLSTALRYGIDTLRQLAGVPVETGEDGQSAPGDGVDPIATAANSESRILGDQEAFVGALARNLQVRQVGGTYLVDVRYSSPSPQIAAAIPNTIVDTYLDYQLEQKFGNVQRVTDGLNDRLQDLRTRVEASERAMIEFRNQMLADGFGGQERTELQLRELSERLSATSGSYTELVTELEAVDRLIAEGGLTTAAGLFASDLIERTRTQIAELRQRQDLMIQRFGAEDTRAAAVAEEIPRLETTITTEVERLRDDLANRTAVTRAREEALMNRLRMLEERALQQSGRQVTMAQLEREHDASRAVYETFLEKFTQTSEVVGLQQSDAQVVSYARVPVQPISPAKKQTVLLGMIGGGFLGLGLLFLRALTDRSVTTASQLRSQLSGRPVVVVPRLSGFFKRPRPLAYAQNKPHSALSEAVYSLRSYLMMNVRTKGQVVTMVSARPKAGKTTTSLLLARSLAQMGKSCVVVDTDLRRGSIAQELGVAVQPDLIGVLRGELTLDAALRKDPASGAQYLTARTGIKDPGGVLLSKTMDDTIQTLKARFDVVIIDTAPLLSVSDAIPMAKLADDVVFMVRSRQTTASDIQDCLQMLSKVGVSISGAVLSMDSQPQAPGYEDYLQN